MRLSERTVGRGAAARGLLRPFGARARASAAEVKALAIMLPEEPTDFGWNQQAFDAAKTVAAKYRLEIHARDGTRLRRRARGAARTRR